MTGSLKFIIKDYTMLEFKVRGTIVLIENTGTIVATRIINAKLYAISIASINDDKLSSALTKVNRLLELDNEMFCLLSKIDKILIY